MTQRAKAFIIFVCGVGLLSLALAGTQLRIENFGLFGVLCLLANFSSGLKLPIPGLDGNISLGFVSVLLATTLLSLPEAILITFFSAARNRQFSPKPFGPLRRPSTVGLWW